MALHGRDPALVAEQVLVTAQALGAKHALAAEGMLPCRSARGRLPP